MRNNEIDDELEIDVMAVIGYDEDGDPIHKKLPATVNYTYSLGYFSGPEFESISSIELTDGEFRELNKNLEEAYYDTALEIIYERLSDSEAA